MEKGRIRVHFCMLFVVGMAILFGCLYYFGQGKEEKTGSGTAAISDQSSELVGAGAANGRRDGRGTKESDGKRLYCRFYRVTLLRIRYPYADQSGDVSAGYFDGLF